MICLRNQFIYRQKCHILSYSTILAGHLRLRNTMCTQDYFHPTFLMTGSIEWRQLCTTHPVDRICWRNAMIKKRHTPFVSSSVYACIHSLHTYTMNVPTKNFLSNLINLL